MKDIATADKQLQELHDRFSREYEDAKWARAIALTLAKQDFENEERNFSAYLKNYTDINVSAALRDIRALDIYEEYAAIAHTQDDKEILRKTSVSYFYVLPRHFPYQTFMYLIRQAKTQVEFTKLVNEEKQKLRIR